NRRTCVTARDAGNPIHYPNPFSPELGSFRKTLHRNRGPHQTRRLASPRETPATRSTIRTPSHQNWVRFEKCFAGTEGRIKTEDLRHRERRRQPDPPSEPLLTRIGFVSNNASPEPKATSKPKNLRHRERRRKPDPPSEPLLTRSGFVPKNASPEPKATSKPKNLRHRERRRQ